MSWVARAALVVAVMLAAACGGDEAAPEQPPLPPAQETTTTVPTEATTTEPTPAPGAAITVETPESGAEVSSPLTVAGTANVFEANVTVRLLDERGAELARRFTTATCGSGCRGEYSTRIAFTVGAEQRGTLVLSDDDADGDGKPQHEVRVPLVLVPG
ncbi:MAG TPA: Gmad2 immunoglobulin-like domain-containing protein [Gaiellaceae bacterium]|nr:Gmad2 immunoglobulin-like domain-containing protein [Gaiellaceae bacterium]